MEQPERSPTLNLRPRKQTLARKQSEQPSSESIQQLNQLVAGSFETLQRKYAQASSQNEDYLLRIYIKILHRVLDDVVRAQERVQVVDLDKLLDEKCLKYVMQIAHYREQCFELHAQLSQKKARLHREKQETERIQSEKKLMQVILNKKNNQLQKLKEAASTKMISKPYQSQLGSIREYCEQNPEKKSSIGRDRGLDSPHSRHQTIGAGKKFFGQTISLSPSIRIRKQSNGHRLEPGNNSWIEQRKRRSPPSHISEFQNCLGTTMCHVPKLGQRLGLCQPGYQTMRLAQKDKQDSFAPQSGVQSKN